jgi:hypothetical protein
LSQQIEAAGSTCRRLVPRSKTVGNEVLLEGEKVSDNLKEGFYKQLKKWSQEGHPSGEDVELSNQGPITVFSTPSFAEARSKQSTSATGADTDGQPQTSTASTDDSNEESRQAPLSKEQLGNLLNDFLDQLIDSKPPRA